MIKTFRSKVADGDKVLIRLGTNKGEKGYRIIKLQFMPINANQNVEGVLKIYTEDPDPTDAGVDTDINFDNPLLIGALIFSDTSDRNYMPAPVVIMDHVKFNQDIYATWACDDNSAPGNFYVELEQMNLSLDEATVATLKDLRGRE